MTRFNPTRHRISRSLLGARARTMKLVIVPLVAVALIASIVTLTAWSAQGQATPVAANDDAPSLDQTDQPSAQDAAAREPDSNEPPTAQPVKPDETATDSPRDEGDSPPGRDEQTAPSTQGSSNEPPATPGSADDATTDAFDDDREPERAEPIEQLADQAEATPTPVAEDEDQAGATPMPIAEDEDQAEGTPTPSPVVFEDQDQAGATPTPVAVDDQDPAENASDEDELVEDFPEGVALPTVDAPGATTPQPTLPDLPEADNPQGPDGPQRLPDPDPVPPTPIVLDKAESLPEPLPDRQPQPPVSLGPIAEGAADELTGNAFGCKARCITTALLSSNVHDADLAFEMVTNVQTKKAIWVLPNGPIVMNGMPRHATNPPWASNLEFGSDWNIDITGLTHDTAYRVIVSAVDTQGNLELATAVITTAPEPVDEVIAVGGPCHFSCITSGVVVPGPTYDRASISIETNADVSFAIGITDSPPAMVDGVPELQIDAVVFDVVDTGTSFDAKFAQLQAGTTYYVVARATDAEGGADYVTGSFFTAAKPVVPLPEEEPDTVVMWLPTLHISQDGDAVGSGEISFRYGFREIEPPNDGVAGFGPYYVTQYEKLDAPVSIGAGGFRIVKLVPGQHLPPVNVMATEHDTRKGSGCFNEAGTDPLDPTHCDDQAITHARLDRMTLGWVRTLPTCDSYGVPGVSPNDVCYLLQSPNPGDDHVVFDALIAFRII